MRKKGASTAWVNAEIYNVKRRHKCFTRFRYVCDRFLSTHERCHVTGGSTPAHCAVSGENFSSNFLHCVSAFFLFSQRFWTRQGENSSKFSQLFGRTTNAKVWTLLLQHSLLFDSRCGHQRMTCCGTTTPYTFACQLSK